MKNSLFASLFVVFAATAMADDYEFVLSYTEADFDSVESVKALHRRIRSVARDHCPTYGVTHNLRDAQDCVNDLVTNAIESIDRPVLSAFLEGGEELRIALDTHARERNAG